MAFERLKRKDLSYFELDDEDLSPEAVALGFLEHMQSTSSTSADQYGFRHLTVQEYLAALYACTEVLKKPEDVVRVVEELGCGAESGHLNTFWVFVAGLLGGDLREELFCAIAARDTHSVTHSVNTAGSTLPAEAEDLNPFVLQEFEFMKSIESGQIQVNPEPPDMYRFFLLLHLLQRSAD